MPQLRRSRCGVAPALEQKFGTHLLLRHRTQFADYDKFYNNVYPSSAVSAANGGAPSISLGRPWKADGSPWSPALVQPPGWALRRYSWG